MHVLGVNEIKHFSNFQAFQVSIELSVTHEEYVLLQASCGHREELGIHATADLLQVIQDEKDRVLQEKLKAARELLKENGEL